MPNFLVGRPTNLRLFSKILILTTKILEDLLSAKHESNLSVLLHVCGVFITPSQKKVLRPWSPLCSQTENESESPTLIYEQALEWLLDSFSVAVKAFDERALELWMEKCPESCLNFLSQSKPCCIDVILAKLTSVS